MLIKEVLKNILVNLQINLKNAKNVYKEIYYKKLDIVNLLIENVDYYILEKKINERVLNIWITERSDKEDIIRIYSNILNGLMNSWIKNDYDNEHILKICGYQKYKQERLF
ncbi:hypothetical protein ACXYRQ_01265 [Mycoplasma sp. 394]